MGNNWKLMRVTSFLVIFLTIAALLGFMINLDDKVFNLVTWKTILIAGQVYVAWTFKKLLNI